MENIALKNRLKDGPQVTYEESLKLVNLDLYAKHRKRSECVAKAATTPLPGPLLGAFMDKAIMVRDKAVCRIVPAHFFILQKIESKLLDMISTAEAAKKASVDLAIEEMWDTAYIFVNDPKRMFDLVASGGKEALRKESVRIATEWEAEDIDAVIMAIFEQLKRHIQAKAKLLSEVTEKEKISFFQEPPKAANTTKTA